MPALRAVALLALLLGTGVLAVGIVRELPDLAIAGAAIWTASVLIGLLPHRLDPKYPGNAKAR
jgi:hypothetical protein